jgi:hypothetical protein
MVNHKIYSRGQFLNRGLDRNFALMLQALGNYFRVGSKTRFRSVHTKQDFGGILYTWHQLVVCTTNSCRTTQVHLICHVVGQK